MMHDGELSEQSSSRASSSQASSALARNQHHLQTFESSLLPLLFALNHQYSRFLTIVSYVIEMLQCWAFVMNPYSPAHRMTVALIYMTQFPFWDGRFAHNVITYATFSGLYWTLTSLIFAILCLFAIGAVYAHAIVNIVIKYRIYHVIHFLLSIFFIPTFQTLLSAFVCQKRIPMPHDIQEAINNAKRVADFKEHVVFFTDQSCTDTMTKVNMGVSIVLLIAWGIFSYIALVTVIPVDREDGSIRSRCNTTVDILYYVYRAGLCVCFFLTQAYNLTSVNAFIVAGFSLVMMVMYSLYLPFYSELTNRLTAMWFGVICWSGITVGITLHASTNAMVQHNGMYAILVVGCIVMAAFGYWLSGYRYNKETKYLLDNFDTPEFVPMEDNPFALAAFQRNFDLLPFPAGLPCTDVRFSPYHHVTKGIIEEGLREEAQMESDRLAAESGVANPTTAASAALAAIASVDDDDDGLDRRPSGGSLHRHSPFDKVLAKEGMRRQVVSPTLSRAILPSDAEVSVRFLSQWQNLTQMFPTPYMVFFASRMMNRFMLKHRRDSMVVIAYISFLCDYAPGLGRMTMCVDIMRQCTREWSLSISERYLFYYFSLHVKEALGIRNAIHQLLATAVRHKHQRVLLRTTLVWRNLMEEEQSPMSLYAFTHELAICRYECFRMYADALRTIVDDEDILRNYGSFMDQVYRFKKIGHLCEAVADTVRNLHLMRLKRAFNDVEDHTLNAREEVEDVRPDAAAEREMDAASDINSAGSGSHTNSNTNSRSGMGSLASSGAASSVATSDGRSSQSKVRHGKKLAAQMVERVQELVRENYETLQSHLQFGLLTVSNIACITLLVMGIIATGAVALVIFAKFLDFEEALQGVAYSRFLCESMVVQLFKTASLLPTDSTVGLTVEQTGFLKGNITYFTALIDATEAAHNDFFFGKATVHDPDLFYQMTSLTHFFRSFSSGMEYIDVGTSFRTHIPLALSIARRLVDDLQATPTYQDFIETTDVLTLSDNVVVTVLAYYDQIIHDIEVSSSTYLQTSIIYYSICAAVIVIMGAGTVYLLLWNYRRAASIMAKELHFFTIIPHESVKRIAAESQKQLDTFIFLSSRVQHMRKEEDDVPPAREFSASAMARSFGVKDHSNSVKLLTHLIEHGVLDTDHHSAAPSPAANSPAANSPAAVSSPAAAAASSAQGSSGELKLNGTRNGLEAGGASKAQEQQPSSGDRDGGGTVEPSEAASPPVEMIPEVKSETGGAKSSQMAVSFTGSHNDDVPVRLMNVFNYSHLEAHGKRKAGDRRVSKVVGFMDSEDSNSDAGTDADGDDGDTSGGQNAMEAIYPVLIAAITSILAIVFVMVALFSRSDVDVYITHCRRVADCMRDVGNLTATANYNLARYVASSKYEDYHAASNALMTSYTVTDECRSVMPDANFFAMQSVVQNIGMIALSLLAQNAVDMMGPEDRPVYAMVIDRKWEPFPKTLFYADLFNDYMTPQQIEEWAPFSSSEDDSQLSPPDRLELAHQTFLGPFGLAVLESLSKAYRKMLAESLVDMDAQVLAKYAHFKAMEGIAVACLGISLLVSIYMLFFVRTRITAIPYLLGLYALLCIVGGVVCMVYMLQVSTYIRVYLSSLHNIFLIDGTMWEFSRTLIYSLAYPFVDDQDTFLILHNMTHHVHMEDIDQFHFPQPSELNPHVFFESYSKMVDRRNTYLHYAWLAVVCTIYGRGQEIKYASEPEVTYVRWDMENDPIAQEYRIRYPNDVLLTTFQEDVIDPNDPDITLLIAQSFIRSDMMRDIASLCTQSEAAALHQLEGSFKGTVDESIRVSSRYQWVSFFLVLVSVIVYILIVFILLISSIRAYSRTEDERVIYRTAFGKHVTVTVCCLAFVLAIVLAVDIAGIFFCMQTTELITVAGSVLSIMFLPSSAMAITMTLASWTEYFSFMVGVERMKAVIAKLDTTYNQAYLTTHSAVRMRKGREAHLFGREAPYTDYSLLSMATQRATVCIDPTNPVNGNQQPLLIQLSMLMDTLRSVIYLPPTVTLVPGALQPYVGEALSRIGSLQFTLINNFDRSMRLIVSDYNMFRSVTVCLLVLAAVLAIIIYFVLLRRIEIAMCQQSIGSKLLLLGLPDDVLNTVPEIMEFYDPEAGSSNDQFKRKLQQSEKLLQNILPPNISRRLKNGEHVIADNHPSVTVVFASLQGFEDYSHRLDPKQRVEFLNGIVVAFDHIVDLLDLEKIKTVGDLYFFCGGLTKKTERDHAIRCMECSLFFFQALDDHNSRHGTPNIKLVIGINTDPAVAGVIGNKKVAYDLWGDSVNTASRMYSTGIPGRIQVSENTYKKLKQYYAFEDRHVQAKGKGTLPTHVYTNRIKNTAYTELNWRVAGG